MNLPRHVWARLRKLRDSVAGWIALTIFAAMLSALLLNGLFSLMAGVWARPPLAQTGLLEKAATLARIIEAVPPEQRAGIARASSDAAFTTEWLQHHEDAGMPPLANPDFREGGQRLRALLQNPKARIEAYEPADWPTYQSGQRYALLIELTDGTWAMFSAPTRSWGLAEVPRKLIMLALVVLSTLVVVAIATRHLARPLQRFAQGARRFGVDFHAPPLTLEGPQEVRQAILAFNAMQAQLQHFVQDRTQMLAAISHDLRAPLTRMRLRGEFIDDPEQQGKLFRDVDEMQAMVNAALEFFRDDARLEPATAFDLAELLHTVVDDFKDAGHDVALASPGRVVYVGRPVGLKRMLVNLVDNAIKYGRAPAVALSARGNSVEIRVTDRGPGIAPEHQEAVFAPFYRIEGSRNKHTGGVGLGLAAARAAVLEHGGSLALRNRHRGGLEVKVLLPFG